MNWKSQIVIVMLANLAFAGAVRADERPVLVHEQALMTPVDSTAPTSTAPTSISTTLYGNAIKKFNAGETLSSEEYRALNAGCVGFESHHVFFQDLSTITAVYKDSPAFNAGIRIGDQIVAPEPVEDAKFEEHPTIARQKVKCGRAGTPVDVTVLREGKPVKLTLLRMNIEDIKEAKYRHNWEQILHQLGYPEGGEFSGATLSDLTPAND